MIIIILSVCAVIVAGITVTVAFFDNWSGNIKLSKIRNGIDTCDEVLISSPLYFDDYSSGAEAVLNGEDARAISESLSEVSEEMKFCGTVDGSLGYWDTKLTLISGEEKYTVYVKEDLLYVTGNKYGYCFEPDEKASEQYNKFYKMITDALDKTK